MIVLRENEKKLELAPKAVFPFLSFPTLSSSAAVLLPKPSLTAPKSPCSSRLGGFTARVPARRWPEGGGVGDAPSPPPAQAAANGRVRGPWRCPPLAARSVPERERETGAGRAASLS